jgi:tetratricopeptide (TPR) repeat protein
MNLFRRKKPTEMVENEVDIDPADLEANSAEEYLKRGLIFHAHGDQEKAIADLREVLRQNADSVDALYNLGMIYRDMGKTGEAREWFKTAIDKLAILEETDPVRALMITKLAKWQLKHLDSAG